MGEQEEERRAQNEYTERERYFALSSGTAAVKRMNKILRKFFCGAISSFSVEHYF